MKISLTSRQALPEYKSSSGRPEAYSKLSEEAIESARASLRGAEYKPDELLVKIRTDRTLYPDFPSDYGATLIERMDMPGPALSSDGELLRLKIPAGVELAEALAALSQDERVVYAEGNQIIALPMVKMGSPSSDPNDLIEDLWGLENTGQMDGTPGADISARKAWETSVGNDSPLIAVIDTGVDYNHKDIKANIWTNPGEIPGNGIDDDGNGVVDDVHGYSALDNNGDPFDGNRHGTHVAGTIGAVGNNGEGITGVMQKAKIMPIKIFSSEGRTSSDIIVRALNYASKMGATITNNSWGARPSAAIEEAFSKFDALHVMAAGNRNQNNDIEDAFPSNIGLDNVVVVASSDRNDKKSVFSNYGKKNVDVTAPGTDIWSLFPGGGYAPMSGTSMAAPHVTGTAGLIASAYPDITPQQLKERLIFGSDPIEALKDVSLSGGRINAGASVEDDSIAPGTPKNFSTDGHNSRGVNLTWTAPADDGSSGQGVPLLVRVSDRPITEANFAQAQYYGFGGKAKAGERSSLPYRDAPNAEARTVYFGAKAVDNVGNHSSLVTASTEVPAARLDFSDDFENCSSFEATGNFHLAEDPDKGRVYLAMPRDGHERAPESTLSSAPIDLRGKTSSYLKFDAKTDMYWESEASVEVKERDHPWKRIHQFSNQGNWAEQGVNLSAYDGRTIQIRFKVNSRWGEPHADLALNKVQILSEAGNSLASLI